MKLDGYDSLLNAIKKFRSKELSFQEFSAWVRGTGSSIGSKLDYHSDFEKHMDAWMEFIEFCYLEEDWYDLGCSAGDFLESAILEGPRPLVLPSSDRVVSEQGLIAG